MKPGWQTSEFWVTIGVAVLCAYVAADLSRPTSQVIAALAVAGIKAAWYVSRRTDLKISAADAAALPPGPTP